MNFLNVSRLEGPIPQPEATNWFDSVTPPPEDLFPSFIPPSSPPSERPRIATTDNPTTFDSTGTNTFTPQSRPAANSFTITCANKRPTFTPNQNLRQRYLNPPSEVESLLSTIRSKPINDSTEGDIKLLGFQKKADLKQQILVTRQAINDAHKRLRGQSEIYSQKFYSILRERLRNARKPYDELWAVIELIDETKPSLAENQDALLSEERRLYKGCQEVFAENDNIKTIREFRSLKPNTPSVGILQVNSAVPPTIAPAAVAGGGAASCAEAETTTMETETVTSIND